MAKKSSSYETEEMAIAELSSFILSALASQKEEIVKSIWEMKEDARNDGQIQYLATYTDIINNLTAKAE